MSKGNVEMNKFKWQINVNCFNGKVVGDKITSPRFYSYFNSAEKKTKWYLTLYPKGINQECEGYLSLYLQNLYHTDAEFPVKFSFTLLDQDNVKVDEFCAIQVLFNCKGNGYGCPKFIKENFILDTANRVLDENKLTILCKIIICEVEADQQHSEKSCPVETFNSLEKLFLSQDFSDVTISAENKSLKLHKCILSTRSTVFDAMFKVDMEEKNQNKVEIKDVRYIVLLELFRYMYTGRVNNIECIVSELLCAAEKYNMEMLKALCEKTMSTMLNENNAIDYLNSAILNNAYKLKEDAISWIAFSLEFFVKKSEFHSLDKDVLIRIMEKTIDI